MSSRDALREHVPAERLAEYADGVLGAAGRADTERHLASCEECRAVLAETMAFLEQERRAAGGEEPSRSGARRAAHFFRRSRVVTAAAGALAVAAALLLAVRLVGPQWLGIAPRADRPELAELIAAVNEEPTRPIEGRLTGGFKYAPPPERKRGSGDGEVSPDVRIAAARIEKMNLAPSPDAGAVHALGIAFLAVHDFDRAVDNLERAVAARPGDASYQADLAGAYAARAAWFDRAGDWPRALSSADRAVAIDAQLPEAHFNRAVALEGLHLEDEALLAWRSYLGVDRDVQWRAEAERHVAQIRERQHRSSSSSSSSNAQALRERIEDVVLPGWAEAAAAGDDERARTLLNEAEAGAADLSRTGGDSMPADEVALIRQAISRGDASRLHALADAHRRYGDARRFFLGDRLREAAASMSRASARFREGSSPYQWWGSIYRAIVLRMTGAPDESLVAVAEVPIDRLPERYVNLRGRYYWTKAVALGTLGRIDLAQSTLRQAVQAYERTREIENLGATETHLAEVDWYLGEHESAWRAIIAALGSARELAVTTRRNVILLDASSFALSEKLPESALHFQNSLVRSLESTGVSPSKADAYMQRARVLQKLGRNHEALEDLGSAGKLADSLPDIGLRERAVADVRALRAEIDSADPERALSDSTAAIGYFERAGRATRLARLLTIRAALHRRLGHDRETDGDLHAAVEAVERDLASMASPEQRMLAFDDERDAYADAELFEISRGNTNEALRIAELGRSHDVGSGPESADRAAVAALRAMLPDDLAVIYYLTLQDRVCFWVLDRTTQEFFASTLSLEEIRRSVSDVARVVQHGGDASAVAACCRPVFADLIHRPLRAIHRATRLVIVADGPVASLPFAALPDLRGAPLAARFTLTTAPSLAAFAAGSRRLAGRTLDSIVSIGDGHNPEATGLPRLNGADDEATEVAALYPRHVVLTGGRATPASFLAADAAVLHFAGHTVVNQQFPLYSRLLLAPDRQSATGTLLASDLSRRRFAHTEVVVLATCEAAAGKRVAAEGIVSVARMFLSAGVPSVIASLWPVEDGRTRPLLVAFHRELRRRGDAASALQAAQISVLDHSNQPVPVRDWAGFTAMGGVLLASH